MFDLGVCWIRKSVSFAVLIGAVALPHALMAKAPVVARQKSLYQNDRAWTRLKAQTARPSAQAQKSSPSAVQTRRPFKGNTMAQADALMLGTAKTTAQGQENTSKLSGSISVEGASTFAEEQEYDRKGQFGLTIVPVYSINSEFTLLSEISAYRETTGANDSGVNNTLVALKYGKPLSYNMVWSNTVAGVLPTDKKLREDNSYQGAARVATGLVFKNLVLGSTFAYSLGYGRNFHEYTQGADGTFNLRESLSHTLKLSVPFTEKFSTSVTFAYSTARSYLDNESYRFVTDVGSSYKFAQKSSVSLSVSNEGNALKPNGVDSNIQFFDNKTSLVKLGLTYEL